LKGRNKKLKWIKQQELSRRPLGITGGSSAHASENKVNLFRQQSKYKDNGKYLSRAEKEDLV